MTQKEFVESLTVEQRNFLAKWILELQEIFADRGENESK